MSADKTKMLYVGDAIISVNGEEMSDAIHEQAVRTLRRTCKVVELEGKLTNVYFYMLERPLCKNLFVHCILIDYTIIEQTPCDCIFKAY